MPVIYLSLPLSKKVIYWTSARTISTQSWHKIFEWAIVHDLWRLQNWANYVGWVECTTNKHPKLVMWSSSGVLRAQIVP